MKDLYRKFHIKPDASREEIEAVVLLKPELARQAAILLDENRRARYDRAHAVLTTIGTLRFSLGLDSGDTAFLDRYPDFARGLKPMEKQPGSGITAPREPPAGTKEKDLQPDTGHAGSSRSGPPVLLVVAIAVVIAAVLAILLL